MARVWSWRRRWRRTWGRRSMCSMPTGQGRSTLVSLRSRRLTPSLNIIVHLLHFKIDKSTNVSQKFICIHIQNAGITWLRWPIIFREKIVLKKSISNYCYILFDTLLIFFWYFLHRECKRGNELLILEQEAPKLKHRAL